MSKSKLISDEYVALNKNLHADNPLYGSKSWKQLENVVHSLDLKAGDTLLDYGCGKASLQRELAKRSINVVSYDPAISAYAKHPSEYKEYPFEYVVCMDVLEHVEPDMLPHVLDDIQKSFTKKAFILISTEPSNKTLKDGRNAHLIIQARNFWMDRLADRGFNVEKLVDNRKGWVGVLCAKESS